MYINATLGVQAVHFFIAYIILKKLLFRPAIAVIESEQAELDSLRSAVAARQVLVAQKERERILRWQEYQQQFLTKIPQLQAESSIIKGIIPFYSVPSLSPEAIRHETQRLTVAMVAQVDHVA